MFAFAWFRLPSVLFHKEYPTGIPTPQGLPLAKPTIMRQNTFEGAQPFDSCKAGGLISIGG
jgi:hypothetical protein